MTQTDGEIDHDLGENQYLENQYCEMTILSKTIYIFSATPIKLAMPFFTELKEKVSQFAWRHKRPQRAKAILRKKNGAGKPGSLTSPCTTKLQSSKEYGTGTKTEIIRSIEQDTKLRNKPIYLWSINLQQRRQDYTMEKRQSLQ